jgi:dipeptidyl aminopeptidase/acylaminoacyl peptidase
VIETFLGGPPQGKLADAYRRASPAAQPSVKTPLLLIYGADDEQVDVRTADEFVTALVKAGHQDVSYIRLAKVGHCPHSLIRVPWLKPVVNEFFVRTLEQK